MLKQNMISANGSAEWPGGGIEMEEWPAITAVIIRGARERAATLFLVALGGLPKLKGLKRAHLVCQLLSRKARGPEFEFPAATSKARHGGACL